MLYFNGIFFLFLGDGRAHEKYAAPPGAGESERPVRAYVIHQCDKTTFLSTKPLDLKYLS